MTDDISNVLILNKKSILNHENQLFQAELEKFRSHQNRLISTVHKQQSLLKELTKTYGDLLQDKRVRSDQMKYEAITRSRTTVMSRYRKIFQVFEDLREGLQRAEKFYSEMKETMDSIGKNVEGFVNNRRAEGAQLLSQIEQNKASSASQQASAERERLQQLMERMSMDPSTASSGGSDSRPPPIPSQTSYQNSRSSPTSPHYAAANPDPRFTIPPQKTPRAVETQPYLQSNPVNGYQYPPQQQTPPINPPQHQPQQQHSFAQGAAAPISEGYHPMAYPYQTPISPHPPPQNPQFFPPISTTPQPGSSFYPQHQSPPQPPQSSYQSPQAQYQQHGRFPSNPGVVGGGGGGGGGAYMPPPPPGPPPGSMTSYPQNQGPMPSGPGGYAQIGRLPQGQGQAQGQAQGKHQQQYQQQPPSQGQGDPWAGLNAWR
jgi:ALIX V-shaped domain binding to HIV